VRVVLDTNTALSALLFPAGRLSWMAAAWMAGRIEPLVSAATADELIRVLAYPKFRLDDDDVHVVRLRRQRDAADAVQREVAYRAARRVPRSDVPVAAVVEHVLRADPPVRRAAAVQAVPRQRRRRQRPAARTANLTRRVSGLWQVLPPLAPERMAESATRRAGIVPCRAVCAGTRPAFIVGIDPSIAHGARRRYGDGALMCRRLKNG
jgi:hypothetical protein